MTPQLPSLAVVIAAAGASRRYGRNKLLEPLAGRPVLAWTLQAFLHRTDVAQIILVEGEPFTNPDIIAMMKDPRILRRPGGSCRAQSVLHGVRHVRNDIHWIAIHDAARPLISDGLIDRTLAAAHEHGAAVPALPVTLTIKQARGPLPAPVLQTIPRETLFAMQTPQIMRRDALLAAFESCPIPLEQVTDDVQLIELGGGEVWLVEGERRNLKITTTLDLRLAEAELAGD